jgi:hypothetical protein
VLVAGAATVTFQPDATVGKDASVFDNNPDSNYGHNPTFVWGYGSNVSYGYIEFIELSDPQYQGTTVTSAILSLYVYNMGGDSSNAFWGSACDSPWSESAITWNDRPSAAGPSYLYSYPSGTGWMAIDITGIVQGWLNGTRPHYGMYFTNHTTSHDNDYLNTRSSDYTADSTLRPKLVLEYYGAAIEEATWGEIKATF